MKKIKIGVDAFPYKKDVWSICDYSGEQIYNKVALPLFHYRSNKLAYLAASKAIHTFAYLEIKIRDDIFWSNGEAVTADDYARAILYICHDINNRYCKLLISVLRHPDFTMQCTQGAISVIDNNVIRIKTAWYDPFLPHYLSLLNFSPRHACQPELNAGPYQLTSISSHAYELSANPFFYLSDAPCKKVNTLKYCLVEEDKEGCAFFDKHIHVSCDTALDLTRFRHYMSHPCFHKGEEVLAIILSPGRHFEALGSETLERLVLSLDRDKIARLYDGSLVPLYSWMQLYEIPFSSRKKKTLSSIFPYQTLSVGYEDFYPNRELVEHIAKEAESYNLGIDMKRDKYGHWESSCHLRLEIRKIPKYSPMLLLRSDISRISERSYCQERVRFLYRQLFKSSANSRHEMLFSLIDAYLRSENLYIPLFVFPTGYFCHSNINSKTLMKVGSYVLKNRVGANES